MKYKMATMPDFELSECNRNNSCYHCDDKECAGSGEIMSDCPKYHCDREGDAFEDCKSCVFIRKFRKDVYGEK